MIRLHIQSSDASDSVRHWVTLLSTLARQALKLKCPWRPVPGELQSSSVHKAVSVSCLNLEPECAQRAAESGAGDAVDASQVSAAAALGDERARRAAKQLRSEQEAARQVRTYSLVWLRAQGRFCAEISIKVFFFLIINFSITSLQASSLDHVPVLDIVLAKVSILTQR